MYQIWCIYKIDHLTFYQCKGVIHCNILAPDADSISDHLSIKIEVVLSVAADSHRSLTNEADVVRFPKLYWDNFDMFDNYSAYLQKNLDISSQYDPSQCIDTYIDELNHLLHDAATRADCLGKKLYKPKPYRCPELRRVWWHLWDSKGRPRHGAVHQYYKDEKKLFRKVPWDRWQNIIDNGLNYINAALWCLPTKHNERSCRLFCTVHERSSA